MLCITLIVISEISETTFKSVRDSHISDLSEGLSA